MRYEIRPISDRTGFTGQHEYTPFRVSWGETFKLLGDELGHLSATDVVIEVDVVNAAQIRQDGMLRADAKVSSPAVRIAFGSKHGPLTYATDRYRARGYMNSNSDWQENVRAIALGLEALRKVDRYGITRRGEQYAGWKQIGPGTGSWTAMTRDAARDLLLGLMDDPEQARHMLPLDQLVRRARAKAHPDRHEGDRTLWDQVEQAAKVLGVLS